MTHEGTTYSFEIAKTKSISVSSLNPMSISVSSLYLPGPMLINKSLCSVQVRKVVRGKNPHFPIATKKQLCMYNVHVCT